MRGAQHTKNFVSRCTAHLLCPIYLTSNLRRFVHMGRCLILCL